MCASQERMQTTNSEKEKQQTPDLPQQQPTQVTWIIEHGSPFPEPTPEQKAREKAWLETRHGKEYKAWKQSLIDSPDPVEVQLPRRDEPHQIQFPRRVPNWDFAEDTLICRLKDIQRRGKAGEKWTEEDYRLLHELRHLKDEGFKGFI